MPEITHSESREQTGHTPGPWKYGKNLFAGTEFTVVQTDSFHLAHVFTTAGDPLSDGFALLPTEANARLITAAPELLEALRYVAENHHEGAGEFEDKVLAAIAKAEGKESK